MHKRPIFGFTDILYPSKKVFPFFISTHFYSLLRTWFQMNATCRKLDDANIICKTLICAKIDRRVFETKAFNIFLCISEHSVSLRNFPQERERARRKSKGKKREVNRILFYETLLFIIHSCSIIAPNVWYDVWKCELK